MFKYGMAIGFLCMSVGLLASDRMVVGETGFIEGWRYEITHYCCEKPKRIFTDLKEAYFYASKLPIDSAPHDMIVIKQVSADGHDCGPSSFTFGLGVAYLKTLVTEKFGAEALIEKPASRSWFVEDRPLPLAGEEFTHYHDGELQATFSDLAAAVAYFRRLESSTSDVDRRCDAINYRVYDRFYSCGFSFSLWREKLETLLEGRQKGLW